MNESALAELYDQHGGRLYRYALVLLADAAAAEDAVQEAFVQLARAVSRDPAVMTAAYLTTIVRNECFNILRRRRREPIHNAPMLESQTPGSTEEERLLLESALRALPPEQREVLYLKVFEGLTFHEIGNRCGVSLNTAASRYRYALAAMRASLEIGGSKA